MSVGRVKSLLLACCGAGALLTATVHANAGGFALREQSAFGQGSSFAGIAAGGALSSMFWNPATMTQFDGKAFEATTSLIMAHASHSYTNSTLSTALGGILPAYREGVDNSGETALLPATYSSFQIHPNVWLGLSVNSPFGLSVAFPQMWAGAGYGQDSAVKSFNFSPSIAYKINDMISIAAGVQAQYMTVGYKIAVPPLNSANVAGAGYAYGFTAGITLTPTPTTSIGIGYRSALSQKINGSLTMSSVVPLSTPGSVSTTLELPDMVTVGLRQRIGDRFTLLAGVEWANWSRIGTSTVATPSGGTATIGGAGIVLPFQYSDGWFYSLGGEYAIDPGLTVRAGIAFEKSPITDGVRTPRLPDNDRIWYSVGLSYKPPQFRGFTVDLGYSFIDVKDTPINIGPGTGNPWTNGTGVYVGSVSSYVNILSFGVRYQWDAPAHSSGMKLVTK
jgi:long-chain fatty acid transport protein